MAVGNLILAVGLALLWSSEILYTSRLRPRFREAFTKASACPVNKYCRSHNDIQYIAAKIDKYSTSK
jgi:hypothetical protein